MDPHGAVDPAEFPATVWELAGSNRARERLIHYAELLGAEGELRGLIGPQEQQRLWSRHLINCLVVHPLVPEGASVGDVGSGAGFPGVVLAIAREDRKLTLIEPMERRAAWLTEVAAHLELTNCTVVNERAEALIGASRFDVVTARAVARLTKLLGWTAPLVRSGGAVLALKGEQAATEMAEASPAFKKFGVTASHLHELVSPLGNEITRVVELKM